MNFTREPIIETIITPKEGHKLSIRSSKGDSPEEYLVDAIEVVSFGHSFFFRSQERPKSFLVPVSDYEVVEVREARVALKNAQVERSIKIGGGREAPIRAQREEEGAETQEEGQPVSGETRSERRRDRRGRRRRGGRSQEERGQQEGHERWQEHPRPEQQTPSTVAETTQEGGGASDETQVSSSIFSTLIPPPPTLISETIGRYKDKDSALPERDLLPQSLAEDEAEEMNKEDDEDDDEGSSGSSGSSMSRSSVSVTSFQSYTTTSFGSSFS